MIAKLSFVTKLKRGQYFKALDERQEKDDSYKNRELDNFIK